MGFRALLSPQPTPRSAALHAQEIAMIKDVMVWLDGSLADEVRLAAASSVADHFESHIIALLLNPVPSLQPIGGSDGMVLVTELLDRAHKAGDQTEAKLFKRMQLLHRPVEIRRFDVLADDIAKVAAREARSADTFVALRPNGAMDPERLVEGVLFGSGRHLYLVPETERPKIIFDRILLAWNGSRESARAMTEGMPFLKKAKEVIIVIATAEPMSEQKAIIGSDALHHLEHHGIRAVLNRIACGNGDAAASLVAEAERQKANLIVMGAYGHLRIREWLLGGTTYDLMHQSPIPLLLAH
jgi:nucleotide-binding universal stress UspA family protein